MKKCLFFVFSAMLLLPMLSQAQGCIEITNIEQSDCEVGDNFSVFVSFTSANSTDSVFVFYDGNFFGKYSSTDQPLDLFPLNADEENHLIEIFDTENTNCRDSVDINAVCQSGFFCSSEIHSVSSTFMDDGLSVTVDYSFADPLSEVHILVNNEFVTNGEVGENISQTFEVPNDLSNIYEITVLDSEMTTCADIDTLEVKPCEDILIKVDSFSCNPDGTYAFVVFVRSENARSNNIDISINGDDSFFWNNTFFGHKKFYNVVPRTNSEYDIVEICIDDEQICCETLEFKQPECLNNQDCRFNEIYIDYQCATSDYRIRPFVHGDYIGEYDLFVDGEPIGGNFRYEYGSFHTIRVVSETDPSCFLEREFGIEDCNENVACPDCEVSLASIECNDDGTSDLIINQNFGDFGFDCIDLFISSSSYGGTNIFYNFYVEQNQINLSNLTLDPSQDGFFIRVIAVNEEHNTANIYFELPDCGFCSLDELEIGNLSCNANGTTFNMTANYETINTDASQVDVFLGQELFGTYDIGNQVTLENIPFSLTTEVKTLTICVDDNPNCCETIEYQQPDCSSCSVVDLEIESISCNSDFSTFNITANYEVFNTDASQVDVFISQVLIGRYDIGSQVILENVPPNFTSEVQTLRICVDNDFNCCQTIEFEEPDCFYDYNDCTIENLSVEFVCIENLDEIFPIVDFDNNANAGPFHIYVSSQVYGPFTSDVLPIQLDALLRNDDFFVGVIVGPYCEERIHIDEVVCPGDNETQCLLNRSEIEVFDIKCSGNEEYDLSIDFDVEGDVNIPFSVYLNGATISTASYDELPLVLTGLMTTYEYGIETITICADDVQEDCCFDFTYEVPTCISNSVVATLLEDVSLSPNPTRDVINIDNIPSEVIGLNILDNLGRSVQQIDASEYMQFDVSAYPEGVYSIQFFTADNRVFNKRFVKMK